MKKFIFTVFAALFLFLSIGITAFADEPEDIVPNDAFDQQTPGNTDAEPIEEYEENAVYQADFHTDITENKIIWLEVSFNGEKLLVGIDNREGFLPQNGKLCAQIAYFSEENAKWESFLTLAGVNNKENVDAGNEVLLSLYYTNEAGQEIFLPPRETNIFILADDAHRPLLLEKIKTMFPDSFMFNSEEILLTKEETGFKTDVTSVKVQIKTAPFCFAVQKTAFSTDFVNSLLPSSSVLTIVLYVIIGILVLAVGFCVFVFIFRKTRKSKKKKRK